MNAKKRSAHQFVINKALRIFLHISSMTQVSPHLCAQHTLTVRARAHVAVGWEENMDSNKSNAVLSTSEEVPR